jgi:GDPmannose 4,6-dehydratase
LIDLKTIRLVLKSILKQNYTPKQQEAISTIDKKYFRPAEVDLLIGDPTKAKTVLGWAPKYNLQKIIIDMVDADLKRYYNKN